MAETYLKERAGKYYFRRVLPSDVKQYFPQHEIWKSTRCTSRRKALQMINTWSAKLDDIIMIIRGGWMSTDHIKEIIRQYRNDLLNGFEKHRNQGSSLYDLVTDPAMVGIDWNRDLTAIGNGHPLDGGSMTLDQLEHLKGHYREQIKYHQQTLHVGENDVSELPLIQVARRYKLKDYNKNEFYREARKAQLYICKIELARLEGDYDNPHDQYTAVATTAEQQPALPEKSKPSLKLSAAIDKYFTDLEDTATNTPQDEYTGPNLHTIKEYRAGCALLLEFVGDMQADDLTYDHMRKFKAALPKIPSYRTTKRGIRDKSITEAIEIAKKLGLKCLSVDQREKIFSAAKRFVEWASSGSIRIIPYNIADTINAPRKSKFAQAPVDARKALTDENIVNMVDGLIAEQANNEFQNYPERYWIILIAIHSGLRVEEIAQLLTSDIKEIDEIPYFDANWLDENGNALDAEGNPIKHLKSAAAKRIVPIHSVLLKLGFMEYVAQVSKAEQPRLWMNLSQAKTTKKWKRKFSDWYNGTDRRFGFRKEYVSDDPKKVFHSTRHTVVNWYKQRSHEEDAVAELLGQRHPNITFGTYGNPLRTAIKSEALELMQHDVDFVGRLGHWYEFSGTGVDWVPPVNQGSAVRRRKRKKK